MYCIDLTVTKRSKLIIILYTTVVEADMKSVNIPSYEKIAFIAYNIGVYESVQKFGGLITSGKIVSSTDVAKVAELLSEANAFYDAEMISQLINTMLRHSSNTILDRITADEVKYVMNQLKAVGVSIP
jgi:hypothetical protein